VRKQTRKEEVGVFCIDYDCVECGSETTKVFITKEDMDKSPAVLNKMCNPCLLATPVEKWITADMTKAVKRKSAV
jgi:hypothetical protein